MDNMSTNINELDKIDIQKLTSNIHKEIELGKTDDYLNVERLSNLQQIQMQKLQQLDEIKKKKKEDEIDELEQKISFFEFIKNPLILLLIYILLNHDDVKLIINKVLPEVINKFLILNLLVHGVILVCIYLVLIKIMI